jgi:hypothetical protein
MRVKVRKEVHDVVWDMLENLGLVTDPEHGIGRAVLDWNAPRNYQPAEPDVDIDFQCRNDEEGGDLCTQLRERYWTKTGEPRLRRLCSRCRRHRREYREPWPYGAPETVTIPAALDVGRTNPNIAGHDLAAMERALIAEHRGDNTRSVRARYRADLDEIGTRHPTRRTATDG